MPQIKIKNDGSLLSATAQKEVLRGLAQQSARVACAAVGATTDSSTGAVDSDRKIALPAAFVEVANAATNLAGKATTETALGKIKDAIAVAATKGNEYATILGATVLTNNTGGTVTTPGTIAACDKTVTAAATGAQDTETNAARVLINNAIYNLIRQANQIAAAVGAPKLSLDDFAEGIKSDTLAAITTDTGTAASPGITKAALDAALVQWTTALASLVPIYNAARTASVKVRAI